MRQHPESNQLFLDHRYVSDKIIVKMRSTVFTSRC